LKAEILTEASYFLSSWFDVMKKYNSDFWKLWT